MDRQKITDFATSLMINWTFNPPSAPHMGGVWERLVRSVKKVLYGLVKNHILTDPQLLTLLTEAESIINSRPLTHLSEDVNDLGALKPNQILLGRHRNWASITDIEDCDITSRKKYKQVQAIANNFWSRWKKEYLPTLVKRVKWRRKKPSYAVGELVLLQDDDVKRGKWPLARVTKVMPGSDDIVRTVEVRTRSGTYTRPVAKLFKLEDNLPDEDTPVSTAVDVHSTSTTAVDVHSTSSTAVDVHPTSSTAVDVHSTSSTAVDVHSTSSTGVDVHSTSSPAVDAH